MRAFRFICFFFKGLERNFKIIRYGDVPEIYKTQSYMERYAFAGPSLRGFVLSVKELARHLLRPIQKQYSLPDSRIFYCGPTKNNEREFEFLSKLLNEGVGTPLYDRVDNLSFVSSRETKKSGFEYCLSFAVFLFCVLYLFRIKLGPISLKYLVVYGKVFLQLFSTIRRMDADVDLVIVANDHTDFPVVTNMVMKCLRVPVIYVQHAEISSSFPRLDFDISVLRNKKSLTRYQDVGKVSGDVYIIPRKERSEHFNRLFEKRVGKINVIIYLSSIFNFETVKSCVAALNSNPSVSNIGIKLHPRGDKEVLRSIEGVVIYDDFPPLGHVAVVPNSSVVIELLELGVPVYQFFDLDNIGRDYYGFVKACVVPEIIFSELSSPFWVRNYFDDAWLARFAEFSPATDDLWREQVPALTRRVQSFLNKEFD